MSSLPSSRVLQGTRTCAKRFCRPWKQKRRGTAVSALTATKESSAAYFYAASVIASMKNPPHIEGLDKHADLKYEYEAAWRAEQRNCPAGCGTLEVKATFTRRLRQRLALVASRGLPG